MSPEIYNKMYVKIRPIDGYTLTRFKIEVSCGDIKLDELDRHFIHIKECFTSGGPEIGNPHCVPLTFEYPSFDFSKVIPVVDLTFTFSIGLADANNKVVDLQLSETSRTHIHVVDPYIQIDTYDRREDCLVGHRTKAARRR